MQLSFFHVYKQKLAFYRFTAWEFYLVWYLKKNWQQLISHECD